MKLNIHEAKTHFSKLVAAVEAGEKVTICRNGKPVIECIPARAPRPAPFDAWKGMIPAGRDLSRLVEPTDDDLLDEMGL